MDLSGWTKKIGNGINKYKYVMIVLLAGVIMMMIPGKKDIEQNISQVPQTVDASCEDVGAELAEILSSTLGAGKVKVMLTIARGEETLYQTDTAQSGEADIKTETVLITDSQKNQNGLVLQRIPPVYQGAIVLAQGADIPSVKLALVEAVSNATGLGADKISVLKMK